MKIQGIISIDCSWRGMGVVVYIPSFLEWSKCYDIKSNQKHYYKALHTIPSVAQFVTQLFKDQPNCNLCDILIIENQFHSRMKHLQYAVSAAILSKIKAKLYFISPLTAKKAMGVELQGTHYENKKEMLKTVKENPNQFICASLHKDNDNLADSISLINAFYSKYKIKMSNPGGLSLCPNCDTNTVGYFQVKKEGPNHGRWFFTCKNHECKYFKWDEEADAKIEVGVKRKKPDEGFSASQPQPISEEQIALPFNFYEKLMNQFVETVLSFIENKFTQHQEKYFENQ